MEQVSFSREQVDALAGHFRALTGSVPLRSIRSPEQYEAAIEALNALIDAGAGDEAHPLAPLLDLLGDLVAAYDDQHHRLTELGPAETLRFLMEQHGLRQSDLPEVGSQGVVSEILSGRRDLNVRQIRLLAERFHVSAATFV